MTRSIVKALEWAQSGEQRSVKSGHLDEVTLGTNDTTIYAREVPQDKIYWHGHGDDDRDSDVGVHIYADLVALDGTALEGELVLAITDSEQRNVLAQGYFADLETLRDAVSEARTERPMFPAHGPYANGGRHIEYRLSVADEHVGKTLDPGASDVRLFFTEQA